MNVRIGEVFSGVPVLGEMFRVRDENEAARIQRELKQWALEIMAYGKPQTELVSPLSTSNATEQNISPEVTPAEVTAPALITLSEAIEITNSEIQTKQALEKVVEQKRAKIFASSSLGQSETTGQNIRRRQGAFQAAARSWADIKIEGEPFVDTFSGRTKRWVFEVNAFGTEETYACQVI